MRLPGLFRSTSTGGDKKGQPNDRAIRAPNSLWLNREKSPRAHARETPERRAALGVVLGVTLENSNKNIYVNQLVIAYILEMYRHQIFMSGRRNAPARDLVYFDFLAAFLVCSTLSRR